MEILIRPQEKQGLKQYSSFEKIDILAMIESGKFEITFAELQKEFISYSSAIEFSKVTYS